MAEELDAQQKLQWLGLKQAAESLSDIRNEIEQLQKSVGDYDTFVADVQDMSDYPELKTYLENNGFSTEEAESFIEKTKSNFESFDEFKDSLISGSSYEDMTTEYQTNMTISPNIETGDGESAAGIKFHESSGQTENGVSVPAGTTEIYGNEIHFSQSGEAKDTTTSTGTVENTDISVSENYPTIQEEVVFVVTVENTTDSDQTVSVSLQEDGTIIDSTTETVLANGATTPTFRVSHYKTQSHDYSANTPNSVTVTWVNPPIRGGR